MSGEVPPLHPFQLAATSDGSLHPDLLRWLDQLGRVVALSNVPPGGIILAQLTASDIADNFTTGLGNVSGPYEGWAIADGTNGTPDLDDKAPVMDSAGAGTSGNFDNAGSGDTVTLVPLYRLPIRG